MLFCPISNVNHMAVRPKVLNKELMSCMFYRPDYTVYIHYAKKITIKHSHNLRSATRTNGEVRVI